MMDREEVSLKLNRIGRNFENYDIEPDCVVRELLGIVEIVKAMPTIDEEEEG